MTVSLLSTPTDGPDYLEGTADADSLYGLDGEDTLYGRAGDDTLSGNSGNDTLFGGNGNDILNGDTGTSAGYDDMLSGEDGDDTLNGGLGNDSLSGGAGNDNYIFDLDSGTDIIDNDDNTPGSVDTFTLPTVDLTSLEVKRVGEDLVLSWTGLAASQVTLKNQYAGADYEIDYFVLKQSPVSSLLRTYSFAEFLALKPIHLSDYDDAPVFKDISERILADGGNDTIMAGGGDDLIDGGAGDDVLVGGQGNDAIDGKTGNDIYVFSTGDGIDSANVADVAGATTIVRFADILSDQIVSLQRSGLNLTIRYGAGDQVTLNGHFNTQSLTIFEFADGTQWDTQQLLSHYPISLTDNPDQIQFLYDLDLVVYAGAGNDTITLRAGNDQLYGEAGNDNLTAQDGNDTVDGGDGLDTLRGNAGQDVLYGGNDNDSLNGDADNDVLYGGAGNDTLEGGSTGDDVLYGGTGNDSLTGSSGSNTFVFRTGDGVDRVSSQDATTGLVKTIQFEDINANQLSYLRRVGSDLQLGYGASDQITLVSHFAAAANELNTFAFADATLSYDELVQAYGIDLSTAADNLTFTVHAELVRAGAGNDTVKGGAGNDTIYGDLGNDTLSGEADHDQLFGGDGLDTLMGGIGNDSLVGDAGNDSLNGETGDDYLFGGADNDNLTGGAGSDTLEGGTGNDTLTGSTGGGNDVYRFSAGDGQDRVVATDTTAGVVKALEFLYINHDQLSGLSRTATDLLIDYGSGDRVTVAGFFGLVSNEFQLVQFADTSLTIDQLLAYYDISLTASGDNMTFTAHGEHIQAGAGNDTITAGAGDDIVYGDLGADALTGGLGHDTLYGGDGNDTLTGNDGDDVLDGGVGNDSYVLGNGNDTVILRAGGGTDTVNAADTAGGIDVLVFEDVATSGIVAATQSSNNLIIDYAGGARVTITGQFVAANAVEGFLFADGVSYTAAELLALY
ncbi:calcium-binding protein [Massilia sp. SM-13]|uniref:calcium-binding protein n=1 Tax=Pseudoduganella rhizocola TaxID=3382643 RepID=UPI0038B47420